VRPAPPWSRTPAWRRAVTIAWLALAACLVPAAVLVATRVAGEGATRVVAIVMDEVALAEQASYLGLTSLELGLRYQALGLTGIALYEDTLESAAGKGRVAALRGADARAIAAAGGGPVPPVAAQATLATALVPGALDVALAATDPPPQEIDFAGRTWFVWPGDSVRTRPVGPDRQQVAAWHAAGFDIAYRPRNFPNLRDVGASWPAEARYIVHAGLQVAGHPHALEATVLASAPFVTGIIEGTAQDGLRDLAGRVPTARLLSFNQDYVNLRLRPDDLVDKYLLAANERNVRLLYLRPYTEQQLGDMVANTEALIVGLVRALERDGFTVGPLPSDDVTYVGAPGLRVAAGLGIMVGLVLLALAFPAPWGALAAAAVAALALVAAGPSWAALALVAALVFPVLGFAYLAPGVTALLGATGVSLAGAVLLVAVGSERATMLALEPFAGVAATLVVPPALFAVHALLRFRGPASWLRFLWGYRIRLGDAFVALAVVAVLGLVVIRRGNLPIVGASEAELALRAFLNDLFVRPRFKELVGHPLALLALLHPRWPAWATAPLLVAGVVAQASILNSFSHYHTPVVVSLGRTAIALGLGLVIGLVLVPVARLAIGAITRWLAHAPEGGDEGAPAKSGD